MSASASWKHSTCLSSTCHQKQFNDCSVYMYLFFQTCFLESVDKAASCCPLCRMRVSNWTRLNNRRNTLVDQRLWNEIQAQFPLLCQRRLSGLDTPAESDQTGIASSFDNLEFFSFIHDQHCEASLSLHSVSAQIICCSPE